MAATIHAVATTMRRISRGRWDPLQTRGRTIRLLDRLARTTPPPATRGGIVPASAGRAAVAGVQGVETRPPAVLTAEHPELPAIRWATLPTTVMIANNSPKLRAERREKGDSTVTAVGLPCFP